MKKITDADILSDVEDNLKHNIAQMEKEKIELEAKIEATTSILSAIHSRRASAEAYNKKIDGDGK